MAYPDPQQEHMRRSGLGVFAVALAIAALVGFSALATVTRILGAAAIPIWGFAGVFAVFAVRGPIGQALARRLDARQANEPVEVPPELYAELDELRARLGELEERADFAERLLSQRDAAGALKRPEH